MARPRSDNYLENTSVASKQPGYISSSQLETIKLAQTLKSGDITVDDELSNNELQADQLDDDDFTTRAEKLYNAKLRKLTADAQSAEIRNQILLRQYISIEEIRNAISLDYQRVRTKLLSLRPKILKVLMEMTDVNEATTYFDNEINEILAELSYEKTINE